MVKSKHLVLKTNNSNTWFLLVFYTHVHFLEVLETSVDNNVVLIRPQHRSHVHLEEENSDPITLHILVIKLKKTIRTPAVLTLLFSLCITPIKRTLTGNRSASMMKPQTQDKLCWTVQLWAANGATQPHPAWEWNGEALHLNIYFLQRCGCIHRGGNFMSLGRFSIFP